MRLRNMLRICLVFWKSEPKYAYKRYAYKKNMYLKKTLPLKMQQLDFYPIFQGYNHIKSNHILHATNSYT